MNSDRQKILTDYISYLYTTRRTYDTIGKYIKYVSVKMPILGHVIH